MPFRHFLQPGPRAARLFVVALALLQLVAPTWHICALGGHVANHRSAAHHGAASFIDAALADTAPNRPLICFCAPHPKPLDPNTPRLIGNSPQDHATCLALLLQTMPGQISAPPAILESRALIAIELNRQRSAASPIAAPRHRRGRAPPLRC